MQHGVRVHRVAFHGGDVFDSRVIEPTAFTQAFGEWPHVLTSFIQDKEIDCLVLFGQSRRHHKTAIAIGKNLGLAVVVLEEGYFRPGFVTMELDGVNGYSTTLHKFAWSPTALPVAKGDSVPRGQEGITADISPWHFQKMALQASLHYQAMWKARRDFTHYQHHRADQPTDYATYWMRSWFRKVKHMRPCRRLQQQFIADKAAHPYFFVPLQHDGDAQITHHSKFSGNGEFVAHVMHSFAQHALKNTFLVFRQHPHARGGPGHQALVASTAKKLDISQRVFHLVEGDTPELAEHSAGVVLINSTVGLQALERGAPLMVLGDALYKHPELTFTGELDQFWQDARTPDPMETASFLAQIKNLTQAPASVYALRSEPIRWNALLGNVAAGSPSATTVAQPPSTHSLASGLSPVRRRSSTAVPETP